MTTALERAAEAWERWPDGVRPPRRSVNGHHPDCPYGRDRSLDPATCGVCQGIRKGDTT